MGGAAAAAAGGHGMNWRDSIFAGRLLTRRERLAIALIIGMAAGMAAYLAFLQRPEMLARDFTYPWRGGAALLAGQNPYEVIRPTGPPPYDHPFMYPLTAAIVAAPFALLPVQLAGVLFVVLGMVGLVYLRTDRGLGWCWTLLSVPACLAVVLAQWAPWLMAGSVHPALGWTLACKPTLGLALFAYRPSWRTAAGAGALTALAFLVDPGWLPQWIAAARTVEGHPAPVTHPAGLLAAAALLRWRHAEARLVGVMALVPQNPYFYDQLPLWLVARTPTQALGLTVLSWVAWLGTKASCGGQPFCGPAAEPWVLGLLYVPAAALALLQDGGWARARAVVARTLRTAA